MKKHIVNILAIETSCDETAAAVLRVDLKSKQPHFDTLSSVVKSQIKIHSKFGGVVPEVAARAHVASIRPVVEKALADARASLITSTKGGPAYGGNPLSLTKSTPDPIRLRIRYQGSRINPLLGVDYIAVTAGPGLIMSLLVGVEFAKALSFATGIPLIKVNHMEGHLFSPFGLNTIDNSRLTIHQSKIGSSQRSNVKGQPPDGETGKLKIKDLSKIKDNRLRISYPVLSVVVSGGHTMLVLQKHEHHYKVLGSTVDDAAGEAFDKVAKLLELPYPGGPEISKLASKGEPTITFPRPMLDKANFDFSFSGLKTAVLYYLQEHYPVKSALKSKNKPKGGLHHFNFGHIPQQEKADIARSFEEAVVDVLVTKAMRAVKQYNCKTVSLSGGVAANRRLREALQVKCQMFHRRQGSGGQVNVKCVVPPVQLCTDNAEMIGIAAYIKLRSGYKPTSFDKLHANSAWEL